MFLNSLPVHYFCSTWLSPSPLCCCFDSLFLNFIHFSTVYSSISLFSPRLQQQTFSLTKFSDLSSRTQSELEEHEIRWRFVSDHTAQWLSLALDTTPPPGQHLMRRREHVKKTREIISNSRLPFLHQPEKDEDCCAFTPLAKLLSSQQLPLSCASDLLQIHQLMKSPKKRATRGCEVVCCFVWDLFFFFGCRTTHERCNGERK